MTRLPERVDAAGQGAAPRGSEVAAPGRWVWMPWTKLSPLWVVLAVGLVFAATAQWGAPYNVDAYTNALQARSFAAEGSPVLDEAADLAAEKYQGRLAWIVPSEQGPAAQYPPGVGLWGAPFYLFDTELTTVDVTFDNDGVDEQVTIRAPSLAPATAAAVVSVVVALYLLALVLRDLLPRPAVVVAVVVAGMGTGAWSVASNMLWQHGPAMMAIAAGVYAASAGRFWMSGVAFGAALMVRPHTAVIAAAVGLWCAWKRRTIRPALAVGVPALVALGALVVYNDWLWGSPGVTGGYGGVFADRAADGDLIELFERLFASVFDPGVGMAITSPFLLVGMAAMVTGRRFAPDWAVGAALGGVAYLLVQYKANRVSGGEGFFGYRYPLEALMAMAPLMALSLHEWIGSNRSRLRVFAALAAVSVGLHAVGAVTT